MEPRHILVVDEYAATREALSAQLEREGFETRAVTNGKEALELYTRERFDLVLCELELSDLHGLEVLAELMERDPSATVVMLCANGETASGEAALRLGAKECLKKPLDVKMAAGTVRRILERENAAVVRGDLRAMSLPSIIQSNCNEGSLAHLLLRRGGEEGSIFFAGGDVVDARLGALVGEEAVYQLLQWDTGEFELQVGASAPERSIGLGGTALLLEGLRRLDEGMGQPDQQGDIADALMTQVSPESHARLAKALKGIVGAEAVIVCTRDGKVLAQQVNGDVSADAALAAFLGHQAEVLGGHLGGGPLRQAAITNGARLTIIVPHEQNQIILAAEPRFSAQALAAEIQNVLGRYRGEHRRSAD